MSSSLLLPIKGERGGKRFQVTVCCATGGGKRRGKKGGGGGLLNPCCPFFHLCESRREERKKKKERGLRRSTAEHRERHQNRKMTKLWERGRRFADSHAVNFESTYGEGGGEKKRGRSTLAFLIAASTFGEKKKKRKKKRKLRSRRGFSFSHALSKRGKKRKEDISLARECSLASRTLEREKKSYRLFRLSIE